MFERQLGPSELRIAERTLKRTMRQAGPSAPLISTRLQPGDRKNKKSVSCFNRLNRAFEKPLKRFGEGC